MARRGRSISQHPRATRITAMSAPLREQALPVIRIELAI
jgi:hypothetical protein